MNNRTLRDADERLRSGVKDKQFIMILVNGRSLSYEELDFSAGGDNSDHVWLYHNRNAFACVDLRSVAGVRRYTSAMPSRINEK